MLSFKTTFNIVSCTVTVLSRSALWTKMAELPFLSGKNIFHYFVKESQRVDMSRRMIDGAEGLPEKINSAKALKYII